MPQPVFRAEKVLSQLPATLEKDTVYFVRVGVGFEMVVTDSTGLLAYKHNFIQPDAAWSYFPAGF